MYKYSGYHWFMLYIFSHEPYLHAHTYVQTRTLVLFSHQSNQHMADNGAIFCPHGVLLPAIYHPPAEALAKDCSCAGFLMPRCSSDYKRMVLEMKGLSYMWTLFSILSLLLKKEQSEDHLWKSFSFLHSIHSFCELVIV